MVVQKDARGSMNDTNMKLGQGEGIMDFKHGEVTLRLAVMYLKTFSLSCYVQTWYLSEILD